MAENTGLTDDERAELEQLRAEKAAAEKAAADAVERAELEQLRAEKQERVEEEQRAEEAAAEAAQEAATDAHIAEIRERNRRLMEPDDDLRMPLAQKLILILLALIVVAFVVYISRGV